MNKFEDLVDHFIKTDELGHYSREDWSICLYDIENKPHIIANIRKRIELITSKYRFIVLDPKEKCTNINILDIEL